MSIQYNLYSSKKTHTVTHTQLQQETCVGFLFVLFVGLFWNHKKALENRSEWRNHKRCKTYRSPMRKRALGSCNTIEKETTPLRKTTDGIRLRFMSYSGWSSETSDNVFGRFSNNVSGEIWRASTFSSQAEAEGRGKFWLTSVTPVLSEGFSESSGDGGASPSAPRDA